MSTIEQSIEVDAPIRVVYDQWTQFEEFPQFMGGVEKITQTSDRQTHWVTKIAGVEREFDAEITEQVPDERVAWTSTDAPRQAGVVTFHRLSADRTKVMLQLDFEPAGLVEQAGDKLGIVSHQTKGDLDRFKTFIEDRGTQSGGWRGTIDRPQP